MRLKKCKNSFKKFNWNLGNIMNNIIKYAKTGVDYISIGALTHSVRILIWV